MAIQTLNTIKNWFKTGLKPSQNQFWDTWDSFRHKNEKIPVNDIEGIDELVTISGEPNFYATFNNEGNKLIHKSLKQETDAVVIHSSETGLSGLRFKNFKNDNTEAYITRRYINTQNLKSLEIDVNTMSIYAPSNGFLVQITDGDRVKITNTPAEYVIKKSIDSKDIYTAVNNWTDSTCTIRRKTADYYEEIAVIPYNLSQWFKVLSDGRIVGLKTNSTIICIINLDGTFTESELLEGNEANSFYDLHIDYSDNIYVTLGGKGIYKYSANTLVPDLFLTTEMYLKGIADEGNGNLVLALNFSTLGLENGYMQGKISRFDIYKNETILLDIPFTISDMKKHPNGNYFIVQDRVNIDNFDGKVLIISPDGNIVKEQLFTEQLQMIALGFKGNDYYLSSPYSFEVIRVEDKQKEGLTVDEFGNVIKTSDLATIQDVIRLLKTGYANNIQEVLESGAEAHMDKRILIERNGVGGIMIDNGVIINANASGTFSVTAGGSGSFNISNNEHSWNNYSTKTTINAYGQGIYIAGKGGAAIDMSNNGVQINGNSGEIILGGGGGTGRTIIDNGGLQVRGGNLHVNNDVLTNMLAFNDADGDKTLTIRGGTLLGIQSNQSIHLSAFGGAIADDMIIIQGGEQNGELHRYLSAPNRIEFRSQSVRAGNAGSYLYTELGLNAFSFGNSYTNKKTRMLLQNPVDNNVDIIFKNSGGTVAYESDTIKIFTDTTTIDYNSSELDITYSEAKTGDAVHCLNISSGAKIYTKTTTGWAQYTVTIVSS